jgi:hypothetical protein
MENNNMSASIPELIFYFFHPEEQEVTEKPKGANKMYADGEWIRVASWAYMDFVGYILASNPATKKYKIQLVRNKHGHIFQAVAVFHEDEIYPADLETDGFDTSFLHDLAIDWCLVNKNEEQFYQLIQEKGGNKDVEK